MRIVAGKYRGHALTSPANQTIRPTSDRIRESLFSILISRYCVFENRPRVLDLFAGTGALGLEAISRGAGFSLFVDNSASSLALIDRNIAHLGVQNQTEILRADAAHLAPIDQISRGKISKDQISTAKISKGQMKPFDLVFADPPYGKDLAKEALTCAADGGWLNEEGVVVVEDKATSAPPSLDNHRILDERKFGDTKIWIIGR